MSINANKYAGSDQVILPAKQLKATAVDGNPSDSALSLWESPTESITTGIWECSPGTFTTAREQVNEVVYIISGKGYLLNEDKARTDYEAGDVVSIPDGFTGIWHVEETTRKIYFVTTA